MTITRYLITTEEQIKTVLDEKISAIYAKDMQGVMDLFAPDIVSFDIGAPLQTNGADIVRKRLEKWFDSYQAPINQEISNLAIDAGDEVAFSHCLVRTYGTSVKGEEFDMWYRATTGFHKFGDKWLITHEHLSEPIDMETGKGMFELMP